MSELTIEKIKSTNGYVNSSEIGFLLSHIKFIEGLLELEQEDCEQVRKNKEANWKRAIIAEAKLNTVERRTAENCAQIALDNIGGNPTVDRGRSCYQISRTIQETFGVNV